MEALGTLAGGIAHDFNNILGTILGNAELARQDARTNWQALVSLDEIQKAGQHAKDLVQQILSFSRRQPTSRRVMSLSSVVEESVRLLRAALPGGMRIECHCAVDTPSIVADPTQVQQVLLNLGTNAAHAMEGRPGNIDIRVEGIVLDETSARFGLNLRPGRYARAVISDTGQGMDAATQRRIFEPFFTTKPPGKGTGLGLSVAHGIMQAHEGAIVAHSELGKGARFELYFPLARKVTDELSATEDARPFSEGQGQHILYIDDDEAQVFLLKRMLERWGYRVSAYLEQREAVDALLAGEPFDLVVTDYNMAGMSGIEVARELRDARPDLPVVLLSGFVTDLVRAKALEAGVRNVIAKPPEVDELRDVIQRLLQPRGTLTPDPGYFVPPEKRP
jgi:CheY-like chemotaxis protein